MAEDGHWFHCGSCEYSGEEKELPQKEGGHRCGEDECPQCGAKGFITCCYTSFANAERQHWDEPECECLDCQPITEPFSSEK